MFKKIIILYARFFYKLGQAKQRSVSQGLVKADGQHCTGDGREYKYEENRTTSPITKQARRNVATLARKACEPYLND